VKAELRRRHGLRDRFLLFTGGDDHRKNIAGGIRGFAEVPAPLRRDCQFVIVCRCKTSVGRCMRRSVGRPDCTTTIS
jgi:hypothetical protein